MTPDRIEKTECRRTTIMSDARIDSKRARQLRRLADRIARQIFTNGDGKQACRLVMAFRHPGADTTTTRSEYQTGTGCCKRAVKDLILRHLIRTEERMVRK
jgi:hypothetical protein